MIAHPYADKFPMLPDSELTELAESIATNGLRQPIVVDREGRILDGRNRAKACQQVGIEPVTVTYDGDDLAEYVIDCNTTRRHMSTGARAMATALVLAEDGRRENGRWKRGSVSIPTDWNSASAWREALNRAGTVLDFTAELASRIVSDELELGVAYQQAKAIKDSAERDKVLERERRKRERDEAKAEAERNAQIVADLTIANSQYVADIETGRMTPKAAWAAHLADTEKERRAQADLERGWRDTCTRIAECVRSLSGGTGYATAFLRDFYPHEADYLAPAQRLTRERIRNAIEFLQALEGAIQ